MGKHARKLVVALHVVTSVGWMGQAVALLALLIAILAADTLTAQAHAAWAAEYLDAHVLAFAANTSAFTGLLLAAATPWGFARHWWVATKLVLTVGRLYAGIFVLSGALRGIGASGGGGPVLAVAVGAGLMASGLAVQTWLSVAKPWGRTPLRRRGDRGATAPAWVFVLGIVAPVVDIVIGSMSGRPLPVCSLAVLALLGVRGVLESRRRTAAPVAQPSAGRPSGQRSSSVSSSGP
jgi:hypothetical protein